MRKHLLSAAVIAALLLAPQFAAAQDFSWHGSVAQGRSIEIKGVNGDVRAEPSGSNEVEVTAQKRGRRDSPDSVQIQVVPHAGGVTICAVYPSRDASRPNECAPGSGGRMNTQNNDVTVQFTVHVPAGVHFVGKTVNGQIEASRLNGDLSMTTVNGSLTFSTTGTVHEATTVNGSIRGEMGRADWADRLEMTTVNGGITLTLPSTLSTDVRATTVNGDISTDFPMTIGKVSRRRVEGTIGGGGRTLSLESVNGSITLKKE